jgi:hypothetical protein
MWRGYVHVHKSIDREGRVRSVKVRNEQTHNCGQAKQPNNTVAADQISKCVQQAETFQPLARGAKNPKKNTTATVP